MSSKHSLNWGRKKKKLKKISRWVSNCSLKPSIQVSECMKSRVKHLSRSRKSINGSKTKMGTRSTAAAPGTGMTGRSPDVPVWAPSGSSHHGGTIPSPNGRHSCLANTSFRSTAWHFFTLFEHNGYVWMEDLKTRTHGIRMVIFLRGRRLQKFPKMLICVHITASYTYFFYFYLSPEHYTIWNTNLK